MGAWIETQSSQNRDGWSASPLAWGRGLKLNKLLIYVKLVGSPLAWGRGLKLLSLGVTILTIFVAPRVGAWIETTLYARVSTNNTVAPRVGAWIETQRNIGRVQENQSSPLAWGRGLKPFGRRPCNRVWLVAPRVGAWIETL